MEISDYEQSASSKSHVINQVPKFSTIDMLRDSDLTQLVESVPSKEQEFIDHSLLAPEYLRDSNNLIMDLIDQQVVFQKPLTSSGGFNEKEHTLHSELQFQNAIFQFVNKHGQMQCAVTDDGVSLETNNMTDSNHSFNNKLQASFLTLNGNFLAEPSNNKVFHCDAINEDNNQNEFAPLLNASIEGICEIAQQHKQSVSELALIEEEETLNNSGLMQETDLLCSLSNARKVLPHKKRISIKLKDTESNSDYALPQVEIKGKDDDHRMAERVLQFSCEICGHSTSSQIEFFAHLKHHYEPDSPGELLSVIKTAHDDVVSQKIFIDNVCIPGKKFTHDSAAQVFPDVHINFEDFNPVDDAVVNAITQANVHDDMKILNSNSIDKCIHFVEQNGVEPPRIISSEEIEFSDTEDMLEGIRNVVDKVSIEDTCDAVDMITSNTIRTPWFSNSTFNGISFSTKLIENADFSASVTDDLSINKTSLTPTEDEFLSIAKSESICDLMDNANKYEYPGSNVIEHDLDFGKVMNKSIIASDCNNSQSSSLRKSPEESEEDNDDKVDSEDTQSQFCCSYCSREFNSSNALKYHTRTHTGVRPHQCEVCGRSFFAHGALKSHMRTHTGDKPFDCEQCHRKFRQMGDLKYHVASIHNDVKCHQCEFCGKAFSRKYSLVLHRRIHTSERDYQCDFCPKSFRASIYLQNHRKIHTGEKPYQCEVCSKKFRMSGDLRRHARIHQRKETKVEKEDGT